MQFGHVCIEAMQKPNEGLYAGMCKVKIQITTIAGYYLC